MDHALATPDANSASPAARDFLVQLQRELVADQIQLPAFPDISLQVQRLLMDDNVGNDKVVRLVSLEPVLAGRIMQLANSVALNPRGTPIVELRSAIARLGFNALRAAAVSFAVTQLRLAPAYQNIQKSLALLWHDSVTMAATACVVARRSRRISPDTALFAGLVSGVGKICLLARTHDNPGLASDVASYHEIVRDWHADVTRALLRHWHIADEVVASVHDFQRHAAVAESPVGTHRRADGVRGVGLRLRRPGTCDAESVAVAIGSAAGTRIRRLASGCSASHTTSWICCVRRWARIRGRSVQL